MNNSLHDRAVKDFLLDVSLPTAAKQTFLDLLRLMQRGRESIVVFATEMLGMSLNEFQVEYLTKTTTPRKLWMEKFDLAFDDDEGMYFGRNIACPSNQIGKTVMTAMKHLWLNYYKIGLDLDDRLIDTAYYATLNISPQSRQTKACYQYVKEILEERFVIDEEGKKRTNKLSPLVKDFMVGDNINLGEIRFANKSIFYSVPVGHDQASSLAGGQFGFISYDEAAQSHHLMNELGAKILSRLIKYGVGLDLISTPEVDAPSHQDYLHLVKLGLARQQGWWAMTGSLDQNKFISTAQRTRIKADLLATDKKKYRQVVFGEFVTGGKQFFDTAEIARMWRLPSKQSVRQGHKYLLVADWGMADTGDPSVFFVLDYTDWQISSKIYLVNHETIQGGSPMMQYALLRTLYDGYTWYGDDDAAHPPIFLMDAGALGGVVIKKSLVAMSPRGFDIEKEEALLITKQQMSEGRDYEESEIDGAIIEKNPNFGNVVAYYIDDLATQLGIYHLPDDKIKQDFVMTLVMGVSWIAKKQPKVMKAATINSLAGFEASIKRNQPIRPQPIQRTILH